jgi:hypothetical protein
MAADVLTFDAARRRPLRRSAGSGPGDVLVFSGVRYDRAADGTSTEASGALVGNDDPQGESSGPRGRM